MFPSYLNLSTEQFNKKIDDAYRILEKCSLCHRACNVNRINGELGFCKSGVKPKVSSCNLHFGEEPPISGTNGSGTIFFSNCTLACIFCQNYPISQLGVGKEVSIEKLAQMMTELQNKGAHNVNLVTPTHFVPQFINAIKIAKDNGFKLPIVYNTGGYDEIRTINLLDNIVDIYMPDAKYNKDEEAVKYSSAKGYVSTNRLAIKEMFSQVGDIVIQNGIAKKGVITRVLVLPGNISGSSKVLEFLSSISKNMFVSLMSQYFPANKAFQYPELSRRITKEEYENAFNKLEKLGLQGYAQPVTEF